MADVLDGASDVPTFPLPDDLLTKFTAAARKDGLIDGKPPIQFLLSEAQSNLDGLSKLGEGLGEVAAGSYAAMLVSAALSGPGALFMIGTLIDGTRLITVTLVNNLATPLRFGASDLHLATGHVASRPVVRQLDGTITQANHILGKGDIAGLDGAGVGILAFQKTTTVGVGFLGTEGAIHLTAEDSSQLPEGLFIGWRVPETGNNSCAISVNHYRDAKSFHASWIDDGKSRQTDGSTNSAVSVVAHCAISSLHDNSISMVATLDQVGS